MNMKAVWTQRQELKVEVANAYANAFDWDGSPKAAADVATYNDLRTQYDALPSVYRIREDRKSYFVAALGKIEKQCARIEKRLGEVIARPTVTYGEVETVETKREGRPSTQTVYHYALVTGDRPKSNGWEFVATLEHLDGGTLIRTVPGIEVDLSAYHTAEAGCVHCNYSRQRRDTYVVRHEDGVLKQVGSACLMDYTGGLDPAWCAKAAEWQLVLEDSCSEDEEGGSGGGGERGFKMLDLLTYACAVVRERGWVGSQNEYHTPTKRRLEDYCYPPRKVEESVWKTEVIEEDTATAQKVIEWGEGLGDSDFDWNVKLILNQEWITTRHLGILAYLPEGYRRSVEKAVKHKLEQEAKGITADSKYIGNVGDKLKLDATLTAERLIESYYGTSHLYEFVTTEGDVVKWFASRDQGIEVGAKVHLAGTVKKYDEFRGIKQTILTRCKVATTV